MNKKLFSKLNACLLFLFVLGLSAVSAQAQAQTPRVTLQLENVRMERAMNEIEKQTKYLFISQRDVDVERLVTIRAKALPLDKVLDQLTAGSDVIYEIAAPNILLSVRSAQQAHPVTVTGVVLDEHGIPVIGASVLVEGTTTGTSTATDGSFRLQVPQTEGGGPALAVNFIGYEPVTVPVGNRTRFEITLRESVVQMEQVVVTALGIKREQKALSYNVQQVKSDAITDVKDANFINSLSGKVAGLQINTSSSGVGGAAKVVMRGAKSISASSNALYVIDGIPMHNTGSSGSTENGSQGSTEGIADINPDDIESISVLTGAAAAALYGSNAANGAIVVTTKRGKAGRFDVTFSSNTEFLQPFSMPSFQNRYGTGSRGKVSGSKIFSWGPALNAAAQRGYTPNDFFETGAVYSNSVTMSGGSERNQVHFSIGTVNSEGIVPNNRYNRYNFTFRNTSYFLGDRLKLDVDASYIMQNDRNMVNQGAYSNPLVSAYLFPRGDDFSLIKNFERWNPARQISEQYWPQGQGDFRMQNPYWIAYRNLRENDKKRYMLSAALSYKLTDWLNVSGRVRIDNTANLFTEKLYASSNPTLLEESNKGKYTETRTTDNQTYADILVNINKNFGEDFSLVANIGASVSDTKVDGTSNIGPLRDDGIPNLFTVLNIDRNKGRAVRDGWRELTESVFASVEVGWKRMLYLTVTGRNDWASQLANSSQISFFYPSAGLSWLPNVTFDMPEQIDYLKLRGSFSSVGLPYPRHLTSPTFSWNETTQLWNTKTHFPIGKLHPERTNSWEIGVDMSLWRSLSLSASFYRADTKNQTFDPDLSVSSGYSTIYLQTGHVRNTGVELALGYNHKWGDFGWDSNFTFSWNKNEIVELVSNYIHPELGKPIDKNRLELSTPGQGLGKAKFILKTGGTLGDLYTHSKLAYDKNGQVLLDDDGNPVSVTVADDIKLGSVFPKYNLAWSNGFTWKGIRLRALVKARIGGIVYSATQAAMDYYGVSEASAAARDAGGVTINGRSRIDPQTWYSAVSSQNGLPQYYTYSATNVRLAELSVGYTLPRKWFRNVCAVNVSFVGSNLWMIYNKAPFDPEAVATTGNYYQGIDYFMMPSLRSLGFNVKLTF